MGSTWQTVKTPEEMPPVLGINCLPYDLVTGIQNEKLRFSQVLLVHESSKLAVIVLSYFLYFNVSP